jgi:hypothetical protein
MSKLRKALRQKLGIDLPETGTVKSKTIDGPRAVVYPAPVGMVWVNKDPIHWLAILPTGGKKIVNVQVSKKEYERHNAGDAWTLEEGD